MQCAERWLARGHAIAGIATNDPAVVHWAEGRGYPVAGNDAALAGFVEPLGPDYLISAGNLRIIPEPVLRLARVMALNFHDGPLPEMAGVNVPAWALVAGNARHGVSWHEMTREIDGGGLLVERRFDVPAAATSFQLNALCWEQGTDAFDELASRIAEGRLEPLPPAKPLAYFAARARPAPAGYLDFSKSAAELERLARALEWGPSANPMGLARLPLPSEDVIVREVRATDTPSKAAPGTVVAIDGRSLRVATNDRDVELSGLQRHGLEEVEASALGLHLSQRLEAVNAGLVEAAYERAAKNEAFWVAALAAAKDPDLALGMPGQETGAGAIMGRFQGAAGKEAQAFAYLALLRRLSAADELSVTVEDAGFAKELEALPFLSSQRPLTLDLSRERSTNELLPVFESALASLAGRFTFTHDVFARYPIVRGRSLPAMALRLGEGEADASHALCLQLLEDGAYRLHHRLDRFSRREAERLAKLMEFLAERMAASPDEPIGELSLLDEEAAKIVAAVNDVAREPIERATLPEMFAAQVAKTPDRVAVRAGDRSLTFAELDRRSSQLAHLLRRKGVGPEVPVGVFVERTAETLVALLAIHKAGGAHLPLDPEYPRARVAHMIADSGVGCIVAVRSVASQLAFDKEIVWVDDETIYADEPKEAPDVALSAENLAYMIYTSGSTGTPKGVLIEHGQLSNFFAGMDRVIDRGTPGEEAWLAVTSLSFDISMLELFWTLCRGVTVVLHTPIAARRGRRMGRKLAIDLGLFYFASDASGSADSYDLLLKGARFADENGFSSVWTPERHFHAFGGLYPNPAVTLAALSQITSRVRLCAGSVVSPLHPTPRIAEDFALVDNLSRGRVGISFASGWQPQDFVFAPDRFERRKDVMMEQVDAVRSLWAGESITLPDGRGEPATIRTLPRPVQADIPVWLTAAGSPETFQLAAKHRCGVLTHLLGQTVEELGKKIEIYRQAWRDAGHPGEGRVSLMLHTFVGADGEEVKRLVREPMKRYLRSALDLVQKAAWSFPTFKEMTTNDGGKFQLDHLPESDVDAILDYSFERYYETSGLFGTPERALEMIDRLEAQGVDEVACLIDFGVPAEEVLRSLPQLAQLRQAIDDGPSPEEASVGEILRDQRITHLQCTPSLASMLLEDALAREGLAQVRHWLVGGEALTGSLAQRMRATGVGRISNVYGPTETTVWSTVSAVGEGETDIGRPLLNQTVHVLDDRRRSLPPGVPGELYIGGAGLTRGYHGLPALTADRFVEIAGPDGKPSRAYRTGDRVRLREDGALEYLGRVDHQVKIRGHRIELGEIEAVLSRHPGVAQAVVVLRDQQLVAYVERSAAVEAPGPELLREACRVALPEVMVPARVVVLDALPQTPNGKVDRSRLPEPGAEVSDAAPKELPAGELEGKIAGVWMELLGRAAIGRRENFFDLGGHSLLALQLAQRLGEVLGRPVALMDVFAAPTVERLARKLSEGPDEEKEELQSSTARADARRAMLRRLRS